MARRASTPNTRASDAKRTVSRVRRQYKANVTKNRKLLPGEIPHVENMIVVLKLAGYSRSQMSKVIGISRGQIKEVLDKPATQELLISLRSRLPQAALDLLQGYMIEAVQAIVDVMRSSANDKFVLQAAGEILDRAGMPKASRQERHNVNEDLTTFRDERIVERLREAPVAVQEQAAELIESLENLLAEHADTTEDEHESAD